MPGYPFLTISIDFELFWGVRDVRTVRNYGDNILGVRQAIPAMLELFKECEVHATWATVGLVTFENRKSFLVICRMGCRVMWTLLWIHIHTCQISVRTSEKIHIIMDILWSEKFKIPKEWRWEVIPLVIFTVLRHEQTH